MRPRPLTAALLLAACRATTNVDGDGDGVCRDPAPVCAEGASCTTLADVDPLLHPDSPYCTRSTCEDALGETITKLARPAEEGGYVAWFDGDGRLVATGEYDDSDDGEGCRAHERGVIPTCVTAWEGCAAPTCDDPSGLPACFEPDTDTGAVDLDCSALDAASCVAPCVSLVLPRHGGAPGADVALCFDPSDTDCLDVECPFSDGAGGPCLMFPDTCAPAGWTLCDEAYRDVCG